MTAHHTPLQHKNAQPIAHRGALNEPASNAVVAMAHASEVDAAQRLSTGLSIADLLHVTALHQTSLADGDQVRSLAQALITLHGDADQVEWDAAIGDAFTNREQRIARLAGAESAGWLSAGRPRREALRVALRETVRDGLLELRSALVRYAQEMCAQARTQAQTYCLDYTYLQPAQPTTLGHILLTWVSSTLRDLERLDQLTTQFDQSVAGVGGTSGSRWPFDRNALARRAGNSELLVHTRDAMWHTDTYIELLSSLAIVHSGISQFAQDAEVLCSAEFGVLRLSDAHCRESALMPNKRNPYALVALRTSAAQACGNLTTALTSLHTGSARTDHFMTLNSLVPAALQTTISAVNLATEVIGHAQWNRDRIAELLENQLPAVLSADIADWISQEHAVSYRTAHTVLAHAIAASTGSLSDPHDLAQALNQSCVELGFPPITIDGSEIAPLLSVDTAVQSRTQPGMCAPAPMRAMIEQFDTALMHQQSMVTAARGDRTNMLNSLVTDVSAIAKG